MTDSKLFLVGATHRSAPFNFREKIALGPEAEAALAVDLKRIAGLREFVILNTCNRVEIYAVSARNSAMRDVATTFCGQRGVAKPDFEQFGFVQQDRDVVEHLCQVAAGLDSQILGETEIFGQAKRAYATAQERGSAGPILNRLFQKAFQAAKHVRANTAITTGQVSVANVAVELAQNIFGDLGNTRLLVIGAGEMAEKSAKAFQSRGAKNVCVTNRHRERAESLAQALGGKVASFEQRAEAIAAADIVVCSTASPGTVVSLAAVRDAQNRRPARPLLLIDLAMPRDVDAATGQLENVFLYNLDDLALVAAKNRDARLAEAEGGRRTLAHRADALWLQLQLQFITIPQERPIDVPLATAVWRV